MKKLLFCIFILTTSIGLSENSDLFPEEVRFVNRTGTTVYIKCFPISMVFNGYKEYSLLAKNRYGTFGTNLEFNYINSVCLFKNLPDTTRIKKTILELPGGYSRGFQFDLNDNEQNYGSIGFGKYKVVFATDATLDNVIDTFTIEYDWNYGISQVADIEIFYNNNGRISFKWGCGSSSERYIDASGVNRKIESWNQYECGTSTKNFGNFNYSSSFDNNYSIVPQDSRGDCNILVGVPDENQIFEDNRSGNLSLNLTIDKNITTRSTLIDEPTNLTVASNAYLRINPYKTFDMISPVSSYNNLIIEDSAMLSLGSNSVLNLYSPNKIIFQNKSKLSFAPNSKIIVNQGAIFCNEGASIRGNATITYKGGIIHHIQCSQLADYLLSDSAKIILDSNAVWEIPDSTTIHFTGSQTGLIMKPNSKLKMGVGSKILFDNSAKLIADGATFTSIDSTDTWEGIILQNSSYDTIKNCIFNNAKTALSFITTEGPSYYRRIIQNNIFNVPTGGNYKGIYGENNFRILVKDNTFNMPVASGSYIYTGLYLKNSSIGTTAPEIEEPEPMFTMNVIHNTFNNGSASIILANYISSVSSYYIANNTFNNCSEINLLGMKINGKIKNNTFTSSSVPMGIHLINSYPDLFNNSINSRDVSLHLAGHCYPNLAPDLYNGDMYWTGGMNSFSADEIDNIQLSSSGNVYTDWGNNAFNIENTNSFHIYGLVDSTLARYNTRNNCWTPNDFTKIYLKTYYDTSALTNLYFTQGYDCESITPTGSQTNFIGSEMYDTLTVSDDNSGSVLSDEEILYAQGKHYMSFDYVGAITTYKYLIDNYPDFENTSSSAEYMYECYQALDTTTDTSYRNTLYGNLKIYLEERIESGEHSGDFIDVAYNIILACEAIFKNYNEALNGYEFISLFHPDPNIRLIASWDYEEVEDLINSGSGGGNQLRIRNEELGIEELRELTELKELNRLNKLVKDDPIMSKMKKSYEKSSAERKEKIEKEIRSESKTSESAKENIIKSARLDNQKEDRAKRNIFESRLMNKSEKEKRRMEDMILTTRSIRNEMGKNEKINIPLEYKLEQNYPNPFNPVTTIKFSIPKQSFVTLKIFDILGKEVKTLVNEIKASGNYEIEFNGSNLASGVYFYRLESGEFKDIKRMILIK